MTPQIIGWNVADTTFSPKKLSQQWPSGTDDLVVMASFELWSIHESATLVLMVNLLCFSTVMMYPSSQKATLFAEQIHP